MVFNSIAGSDIRNHEIAPDYDDKAKANGAEAVENVIAKVSIAAKLAKNGSAISLVDIENVKDRTGVSYREAKEALLATDLGVGAAIALLFNDNN